MQVKLVGLVKYCKVLCSSGSGVGGTGKNSRKPGVLARLAASI